MRLQLWKSCSRLTAFVQTNKHWKYSSQTTVTNRRQPRYRTAIAANTRTSVSEESEQDPPDFEILAPGDSTKKSFLKKATVKEYITVEEDIATTEQIGFEQMALEASLVEKLKQTGFQAPTTIQSAAIPVVLRGEDCAMQSYTGSGKTLAYLLPILTLAAKRAYAEWNDSTIPKEKKGQLQALIIAPSQELAMQIVRVSWSLLPEGEKEAVHQLIGGANIQRQIQALKKKPIVVVGTPGRLADLSRNGHLLSHNCPIVVLDEVDELTKIQFRRDMLRLMEHCGKKLDRRQTIVLSATLTPSSIDKIGTWTPDSQFVFIGLQSAIDAKSSQRQVKTTSVPRWGWGNKWSEAMSHSEEPVVYHDSVSMPPNIRHGYVLVSDDKKVDSLRKAIHAMDSQKSLIFMNFAKRTEDALHKLSAKGMEVATLHGDKYKQSRANSLQKFRSGQLRAIIVSDVAARGLDIADCDAVFNLELPTDGTHYAHRAGRTGRMGREGWVLSFVSAREVFVINKLARQLKITIPQVEIRNGEVRLRENASMPKRPSDAESTVRK